MSTTVPRPEGIRRTFFLQIVVPIAAAVVLMAVMVTALILISGRQADFLAKQRQQQLISTVLEHSIERIAHDQESITIWEDAIRQVRKPVLDLAWIDANLGVWLHTYYGHDEVYIVDPAGRAIYGMRGGRRAVPSTYDNNLRRLAAPLIKQLSRKVERPSSAGVSASVLSPGAIDVDVVGTHPAIISVKPILPEFRTTGPLPRTGFVHVSIRYLDGTFVQKIAQQYELQDASFSWSAPDDGHGSAAIKTDSGRPRGYVKWTPFRPGSLMVERIAPLLGFAFLLTAAVVTTLLRHVRRSALALEASEAQAQHLAFHDPLTGLPNRAMFEDRLAHELARVREKSGSLVLLYLDLDGFKTVNDTLGHLAGDELIREVGKRLTAAVRTADFVARVGGDEFAIVQCDFGNQAAIGILCTRIIEAISAPFDVAGTQARVGISLGLALGPTDAGERIELTRKADIALYEAKAAGKGRYVFFAERMDVSIRRREEIKSGLRAALEAGDQLEVYYQLLYSARTGAITGAEALVRWHHPQHGMISPSMFVPIAEETGMIEELGEWVLEQACRTAVRWPISTISVNVSAVQLRNRKFAERVMQLLDESGLDPSRLELEITETSFVENAANCQPNLVALRSHGVKVALDDFGTGYSSFTHLQNFTVDRLKIDRSFVDAIGSGETGSSIIRAIVDLAKASGLQVTAEGVETKEQGAFLSKVGCNSLQGFLLAHPMPSSEVDAIFDIQPATSSALAKINAAKTKRKRAGRHSPRVPLAAA